MIGFYSMNIGKIGAKLELNFVNISILVAAEEGEEMRVEHAEEMEGDPQLEEASVKCLQCQIQCGCHGGDGRHGDKSLKRMLSEGSGWLA